MKQQQKNTADFTDGYPVFTREMKKDYTILVPDMLPWHFDLLVHVMRQEGWRFCTTTAAPSSTRV